MERRCVQTKQTIGRRIDTMSYWHKDFLSRFSASHPLAMNELRKHRENLDPSSLSENDRGYLTMLALCFTVTNHDADYLRRLSINNYNGHLGYLDHIYWLYFSEAFRKIRKLTNGFYRCEFCGREVSESETEIHHLTYDNCGREYVHQEDVKLLCKSCHRRQHHLGRAK